MVMSMLMYMSPQLWNVSRKFLGEVGKFGGHIAQTVLKLFNFFARGGGGGSPRVWIGLGRIGPHIKHGFSVSCFIGYINKEKSEES